ncbi:MAG: hypothetical protein A4E35_02234 [Methanoregula sp. PtaU1.Bin051]|nr:MAG: hypothetical protein A4E35_02234 [Methanoregula sp. PtaU1.Bin051]
MAGPVTIEIIGFEKSECSPFPCNEERTCGLSECYPTNKLTTAFGALETALKARYGNRVALSLTLLDRGVPDRIKDIIAKHHPALPAVLVNGNVTPVGRIALERIAKEIEKVL